MKDKLNFTQAKKFFDEVVAPLINRNRAQGADQLEGTDDECRTMFADCDAEGHGYVNKAQLTNYIVNLISGKKTKAQQSDYLIKLKEMK